MKDSWGAIIFASVFVSLLAIVYAVNPFHVSSLDPRLRIFGYGVFRIAFAQHGAHHSGELDFRRISMALQAFGARRGGYCRIQVSS